MKCVFQFGRILGFCFVGEVLHALLPLPIPSSIYGLILLLAALKSGWVSLENVKETGRFLTAIFPLLFVPAAAGVMELWDSLAAIWFPVLIALFPVTFLVIGVTGRIVQGMISRRERNHD